MNVCQTHLVLSQVVATVELQKSLVTCVYQLHHLQANASFVHVVSVFDTFCHLLLFTLGLPVFIIVFVNSYVARIKDCHNAY